MSAMGKVVRAGVGRRRVQTVVMTLTVMMAVTASVLAAGLLDASRSPFEHAFEKQKGAHLTVQFDGGKATQSQIAFTSHLAGVTATNGPFPVQSLRPVAGGNNSGMDVGSAMPPMTVAGRADTGGGVDDLALAQGHWIAGTGQIVLSAKNTPLNVGDHIQFPDSPGDPTLTVVGIARSASESAQAWVSPAQLTALTASGTTPNYQVLYRFASADTDTEIAADRAAIAAAVPQGSMTSVASYLTVELSVDHTEATYVPFILAFGVLGLVMSILIIGIVVSGAVASATHRIGILKSLGFTPSQVTGAYVAQALIPAIVGAAVGVVLANLLAIPVMGEAATAYNSDTLNIAPWIDLAVPLVGLATVAGTALVPALRAGRLRTADALAVGRAPRMGRGRVARRLLGRLPLPRPMSLGLASPFTRPARSSTTVAAVVLGTIGVTFGVGLAVSLAHVQDTINSTSPGDVVVDMTVSDRALAPLPVHRGTHGGQRGLEPAPPQAPTKPEPSTPDLIANEIRAQPGTRASFATGKTHVTVAGLAGNTTVITYTGDSSWGSYQMVSGSWFTGPGQAVVPSGFLTSTGTRVGDTITLANADHEAQVRIVGEIFDLQNGGMVVMTPAASLDGLETYTLPESVEFNIDLTPGTDKNSYIQSLDEALQPYGLLARPNSAHLNSTVIAMDSLAATLTLMLVAVAGLGVLNTVVLDTRERVHDLGVMKAIGMSPKQTVGMVMTSACGIGLVAGLIGVPIGIALHNYVLPAMATASGTRIPAVDMAVYSTQIVVPLVLGGLIIAAAGAMLPAGWASRTRTAVALRTE